MKVLNKIKKVGSAITLMASLIAIPSISKGEVSQYTFPSGSPNAGLTLGITMAPVTGALITYGDLLDEDITFTASNGMTSSALQTLYINTINNTSMTNIFLNDWPTAYNTVLDYYPSVV